MTAVLECDVGVYTIAGTATGLTASHTLTCDAGVYTISGTAVSLEPTTRARVTQVFVEVLRDQDPAAHYARTTQISVEVLRDQDSTQHYARATQAFIEVLRSIGVQLDCDSGSYAISGTEVALEATNHFELSVDGGVYQLGGLGICLRKTWSAGTTQPFCVCCQSGCDYVSGLFSTGITDSTIPCDPDGPFGSGPVDWPIDKYWEADGHEAYILLPIPGWTGCNDEAADKISYNCDPNLEPGGANGAEVVFTTSFEIAEGAQLDCIVLGGRYSADNYIKSGGWKVNGIDQSHIYHGSFDDSLTFQCIEFTITNAQGAFVIGTNTIEITVKNGNVFSGTFGGPIGLELEIACFDAGLIS